MSSFLTLAFIHLMALMSPGPDFLMVTRNSLTYSRRTGIYTAFGLGLGMLVHAAYTILGIGVVISQSILLFNTIKYAGAAYLIFIGWKALTHRVAEGAAIAAHHEKKDLSIAKAIRIGFLTNVLNPKASLFFLALFTQVVSPETPLWILSIYGLYMGFTTFLWFSFVSSALSLSIIKKRFAKIQEVAERVMGGLLIALGLKVALSNR